jgi:hypothetical protein
VDVAPSVLEAPAPPAPPAPPALDELASVVVELAPPLELASLLAPEAPPVPVAPEAPPVPVALEVGAVLALASFEADAPALEADDEVLPPLPALGVPPCWDDCPEHAMTASCTTASAARVVQPEQVDSSGDTWWLGLRKMRAACASCVKIDLSARPDR